MRGFGSDNNSGIHPDILGAIFVANRNHAVAYGDASSNEVRFVTAWDTTEHDVDNFLAYLTTQV